MQRTQELHHHENWSTIYAKLQWRYVNHIMISHPSTWIKRLSDYTKNAQKDPFSLFSPTRKRGHPRSKWDDYIFQFCRGKLPHRKSWHWIEIFSIEDVFLHEPDFINFMARILK